VPLEQISQLDRADRFVGMWRSRVADFYGKYVATAAAEASK